MIGSRRRRFDLRFHDIDRCQFLHRIDPDKETN